MPTSLFDYIFGGLNSNPKNNHQVRKNSQLSKILEDFPWLWGVSGYWCASVTAVPVVRQNTADLKLILTQLSSDTRYSVWLFMTIPCEVYNFQVFQVPRLEDKSWAEAIMRSVFCHNNIIYLVVVDPVYGEDHPSKSTTILREEGKVPLNATIVDVARLNGYHLEWLNVND